MRPNVVTVTKVTNGYLVEVVDRINKSVEAFVFTTMDEVLFKVKETL